jgi:hypothetical protein
MVPVEATRSPAWTLPDVPRPGAVKEVEKTAGFGCGHDDFLSLQTEARRILVVCSKTTGFPHGFSRLP